MVAAVPPANPSRERIAAAVQLGTAATTPNIAPNMLAIPLVERVFRSFIGLAPLCNVKACHQDSPRFGRQLPQHFRPTTSPTIQTTADADHTLPTIQHIPELGKN